MQRLHILRIINGTYIAYECVLCGTWFEYIEWATQSDCDPENWM